MSTTPFQFGYTLGCKTANMDRVLASALVSTAGGLALGAYPGLKAQEASEQAGYSPIVSFTAGKAPIFLASALSAGLYNEWRDNVERKNRQQQRQQPLEPEPEPPKGWQRYLRYLV